MEFEERLDSEELEDLEDLEELEDYEDYEQDIIADVNLDGDDELSEDDFQDNDLYTEGDKEEIDNNGHKE